MNREEFLLNIKKCVSYLEMHKFDESYEKINLLNYRREYSTLTNNTIRFGIYSESIYEKYFVNNCNSGRKLINKPRSSNYIEYLFDDSNSLEYIIYHYGDFKEIWKFIVIDKITKIGINNKNNCLFILQKGKDGRFFFHRFFLDRKENFSFEYYFEDSKVKNNFIECIFSTYTYGTCHVDRYTYDFKNFNNEKISNFSFSQNTINGIIEALKLDENEKRIYLFNVELLKETEEKLFTLNKVNFENGLMKTSGKELEDSIF